MTKPMSSPFNICSTPASPHLASRGWSKTAIVVRAQFSPSRPISRKCSAQRFPTAGSTPAAAAGPRWRQDNASSRQSPAPATRSAPLSGAAWWDANQAKYPNSSKLADLASPFREKVIAFTNALKAGGARISVGSTLRSPVRAKLMLYSWEVANGERAPNAVPVIPGCAINWDHGDLAKSKKTAREMVRKFGIVRKPSTGLSLHTMGRAIDMTVSWTGTIVVKDATGVERSLDTPRSGENNTALHAIGATYGVIKFAYLPADPPHWSDNGH